MLKRELALKACPRCSGDLYVTADMYGNYAECIQCGYMKDLERTITSPRAAVATKVKAA